VGLVYDSRGLLGVTTVRLGVAGALHPGSSARCEGEGAPARPRADGRGLWPVSGAAHVRVSGGDREREGGREEVGR
jgi:hypothetical protein